MKRIEKFVALTICLCLVFTYFVSTFGAVKVSAAESLEARKEKISAAAINYLESSVNEDINDETYLINEYVAVLSRFSDSDVSKTVTWLLNQKLDSNIDTMSRSIIANIKSQDIKKLLENQNKDGGFGLTDKYRSDILDSILVLEAVNSLDKTIHTNSSWRLVNYIAGQMREDGSFSYTKNSGPDMILTSMALYAVSKYMSDRKITSELTADMISKAEAYLKTRFDNTFSNDSFEVNLYIALALQENHALVDIDKVIDNLAGLQKDNGSFGDSIHLTSLVVWFLGKMDTENLTTIYDLRITNTSKAYYEVETGISVAYAIMYKSQIDKEYQIKCTIYNGQNIIYEDEIRPINLTMDKEIIEGAFEGISIKENKDDGVSVKVQLIDGDSVVKEAEGKIILEDQPRAGETNIDDFSLELSDHYAYVNEALSVNAVYKLLYCTNISNSIDMAVKLFRDDQLIDEKVINEKLISENDSVVREAISFEPDTSQPGIYTVTVSACYGGETIAEYSEYFCIVMNPEKDKELQIISDTTPDAATPTDAPLEEEIIPFTVSWIGPKLSEYVVYAGKKKPISVNAGIIYYGDESFKGNVVTELISNASIIQSESTEVDIPSDKNSYDLTDIMCFSVETPGEYVVKVTLVDESGNEIISGSKYVKVIEKKKVSLIAENSISESEDRTVDIRWNDISNSQDIYNYRLYRRAEGNDWEARSVWNETQKVRVLNIYPHEPLLEEWMTNTISNTENPAGMGMFNIDSLYIQEFNENPEGYLKDEEGFWKYDVLFFGSWDSNDFKDLSKHSADVVQSFIDTGRGVLFGHDTICEDTGMTNFLKFADQLGIKVERSNGWSSGTSVSVIKMGTLTNFPWTLRGTLNIPETHSLGQYAGGSLAATEWMSIDASRIIDSETGAHSNSYLVSNKNLAMIQTGHSNGLATDDERKIIANTLFYLHQLSAETTAKDNSFYDLASPDVPEVRVLGSDGKNIDLTISTSDNGTKYQYYIEGVSSTDSEADIEKSNIMTSVAISGIDGYVFAIDDSPEADKSILEFDEHEEKVTNVVKADSLGVLKTSIEIPENSGRYYLHIYAVDNENNISEERVISLDEGWLATDISTDKDAYNSDEVVSVNVVSNAYINSVEGDIAISLYDSEDNFVEEIYFETGLTVSRDAASSIETSIYLDEYYSGEYKLKAEWMNKDKILCYDMTSFRVDKTSEEYTEEVVDPISPSELGPEPKYQLDVSEEVVSESGKQNNSESEKVNNSETEKINKPSTDKEKNTSNMDIEDTQKKSEPKIYSEKQETITATTEASNTVIEASKNDEEKNKNADKNHPETGEYINLIFVFACMVISAGVIAYMVWRKRKSNNK